MEEYHDRIVAFHIGRGGRFNELGHITYVPYVECMQDLYLEMTLISDDEEGYMLPFEQHVLMDSGGNEVLRGWDIYEKTGTLDIDGDNDKYVVLRLDEIPEKYEKVLMEAVKDGQHMTTADRVLFAEYLAERGYNKAEMLLDDDEIKVYNSLSEFVGEDKPIDPYSFYIYELDSNKEARLVKFNFTGIESVCIIYADGTAFTLDDWQSPDYPTTMGDVENYEWVDSQGRGTIIVNRLPRTPFWR